MDADVVSGEALPVWTVLAGVGALNIVPLAKPEPLAVAGPLGLVVLLEPLELAEETEEVAAGLLIVLLEFPSWEVDCASLQAVKTAKTAQKQPRIRV